MGRPVFIGDSIVHWNLRLALRSMERTWRLPYGSVETFSQNGWGTREFLDDRFGMLTKAIDLEHHSIGFLQTYRMQKKQ